MRKNIYIIISLLLFGIIFQQYIFMSFFGSVSKIYFYLWKYNRAYEYQLELKNTSPEYLWKYNLWTLNYYKAISNNKTSEKVLLLDMAQKDLSESLENKWLNETYENYLIITQELNKLQTSDSDTQKKQSDIDEQDKKNINYSKEYEEANKVLKIDIDALIPVLDDETKKEIEEYIKKIDIKKIDL